MEIYKKNVGIKQTEQVLGEVVDLPHTWNGKDGQDGGNDYYRGTCWYVKEFDRPEFSKDEEVWIEFAGVAMRAKVYVNQTLLKIHDGGYSTFRVNITDKLQPKNVIAVSVDNSENREVYPQKADFTFYGGIYRDVKLLVVPKAHFALDYYGGNGIRVTPRIVDDEGRAVSEEQMEGLPQKQYHADIDVEIWTGQTPDKSLVGLEILDADGRTAAEKKIFVQENHTKGTLQVSTVHLWNGKKSPYLYTLRARLKALDLSGPDLEDELEVSFGCRSFRIDPEKGFFLNGEAYPLCGAARHQDRWGVGNPDFGGESEQTSRASDDGVYRNGIFMSRPGGKRKAWACRKYSFVGGLSRVALCGEKGRHHRLGTMEFYPS